MSDHDKVQIVRREVTLVCVLYLPPGMGRYVGDRLSLGDSMRRVTFSSTGDLNAREGACRLVGDADADQKNGGSCTRSSPNRDSNAAGKKNAGFLEQILPKQ